MVRVNIPRLVARRIGEISRTLEKAQHGGAGGGSKIPAVGISKRETLKSAGLSTSATNRRHPDWRPGFLPGP